MRIRRLRIWVVIEHRKLAFVGFPTSSNDLQMTHVAAGDPAEKPCAQSPTERRGSDQGPAEAGHYACDGRGSKRDRLSRAGRIPRHDSPL